MLLINCRIALLTLAGIVLSRGFGEVYRDCAFYIKCCMDNVTVDKHIQIFPNQKPWMTSKVRCLLKKRNTAFRSGDKAQYSTARADLRRGIKEAKDDYRRKIEVYLEQDNSWSMWRGIQHITKYKHGTNSEANGDASLCEQLNCFFARFEANRPVLSSSSPPTHAAGT